MLAGVRVNEISIAKYGNIVERTGNIITEYLFHYVELKCDIWPPYVRRNLDWRRNLQK